jgi:serine/threonine-protein kinase
VTDATPASPVPIGAVLADKYVVEQILGVGGMGVVVAARHRVLDQRVALKFLHGPALANPEIVQRFIREARAVVKLESQYVARVSDVGVLDTGSPFIVMELLSGRDLAQRLEAYPAEGPVPVAEAVDRILEALDALAEAHSHDIVHRDLKPANLFLAQRADGTVATKVLDFGISKVLAASDAPSDNLTRTMATLGTPLYMAPEQVRSSRSVDVRTDIWSIGVVMYELLAGRPPFDADSMGGVFAAIIETVPAPLASRRPDLPPGLEAVVLRCLEKDPQKRFSDVADLARALAPFGSGRAAACVARASAVLSRRDRRSGPEADSGASAPRGWAGAPSVSSSLGFSQPGGGAASSRSRGMIALAIVAGVIAVVGVAAVVIRGRATQASVQAAEPVSPGSVDAPAATPSPPEKTNTGGPTAVPPQIGVPPELASAAPSAAVVAAPPPRRPAASAHHAPPPPSATVAAPALPEDRL